MSSRSGRAVYFVELAPLWGWLSQLAVRSALRGLQPLALPPMAALLSIPQPAAAAPPVRRKAIQDLLDHIYI